jgi:23S rRNA (guanosine2251-2'-O)-methyltransferase
VRERRWQGKRRGGEGAAPGAGRERRGNSDRGPAPRERRADPERALWLYGRHVVATALANPKRRIRRLIALPDAREWLDGKLAEAAARGQKPETLDRAALETLLPEGAVHQGVALLPEPLREVELEDVIGAAGETTLVVLLDRVTDPHNVGAVLRSAAVFGAVAVIVPEYGAPEVTGVLAKAASGALEHVPLVRVTNLARAMDTLKEAEFWCVGLDEEGERTLGELAPKGRVALALGAEGAGLRRLTRERCDALARLPSRGPITSLNVSNAAAVALYELTRDAG